LLQRGRDDFKSALIHSLDEVHSRSIKPLGASGVDKDGKTAGIKNHILLTAVSRFYQGQFEGGRDWAPTIEMNAKGT
jgi:hypothetical protein